MKKILEFVKKEKVFLVSIAHIIAYPIFLVLYFKI
jgi:hypothetical protein